MVKKKKGFTIVELVIVIAVIAILAAVLIPTFATMISKANDSADIQLVRNLNAAIADGLYVENELDTAENIRDHLAKNGYGLEDLVTKNSDNVLAFNKETRKVEAINLSKFGADDLGDNPIYDNEIIGRYIIFSAVGNDTAEGLYDLRNFPSNTEVASIGTYARAIATIANDSYLEELANHVENALNKIDKEFRPAVADVINKTIYVIGEDMYVFNVDSEVKAIKVGEGDNEWHFPRLEEDDKVPDGYRPFIVFNSDVKEFNVDPLMQPNIGLYVVIPNHVSITGTKPEYSEDLPIFAGNINRNIIPKNKIKSINSVKETVEKLSDVELMLYGMDQVYTSDRNGDFSAIVAFATKMLEDREDEDATIRIVVNSNVTVNSNITIPKGITVEIPFAIGNYEASRIMADEGGDFLSSRALGEAYPAHDKEHLDSDNVNDAFYLCGEGPGNGFIGAGDVFEDPIFEASKNIATESKLTYSLTIANGSTLTINGKVRIGGIIGYTDATGYQGHTSGQYAQINNNGKIVVENGGVLDVWGFIKGSGEVIANEGGLVYEPFVVTDYLDTVPTIFLYPFVGGGENSIFNSPFMRFTVMNIQTKCTINYGSALYVRANLVVFSAAYARANAPMITSNGYYLDEESEIYRKAEEGEEISNGALVLMDETASIEGKYDGTTAVNINASNNGYKAADYELADPVNKTSLQGDVGVNKITIHGNVETDGIKMDLLKGMLPGLVLPVDTSYCILPLSYLLNFVVASDGNLTIGNGNRYALMPGAEFTVNGTLTIEEGSALYALDAYDNSEFFQSADTLITSSMIGGMVLDNGLICVGNQEAYDAFINAEGSDKVFAGLELPFIARKYYPSSTLLQANGFAASAKFTVDGKLYVESGAGIGGIVNATKTTAEIELEEGAILGEVWNGLVYLGGPFDTSAMFFGFLTQNFDAGVATALSVMTFTTQQCFFRLIGPDGEMDLSNYYESSGKVPLSTLICDAFGIEEAVFELMCAIDPTLTNAYGEDGLEVSRVTNGHYTFKLNSTSGKYVLQEASTIYVVLNEMMQMCFKASTMEVGTEYYGGNWSIETIEDGATD